MSEINNLIENYEDPSWFLDDAREVGIAAGVKVSGGKGHIAARLAIATGHPAAAALAARFAIR